MLTRSFRSGLIAANLAMATCSISAIADDVERWKAHPVFGLFPNADEIAAQIVVFEREHPGAVGAIRGDLDQGIRANLVLLPQAPQDDEPRPIKRHVPTPYVPSVTNLRNGIEKIGSSGKYGERVEFLRAHFDELSIDDTREGFALVMLDMVANGWEDWSHWDAEDPRLNEVRAEWKEVHRFAAFLQLHGIRYAPATGVLLRQWATMDENACDYWRLIPATLEDLPSEEDREAVLRFCVDFAEERPLGANAWRQLWAILPAMTLRESRELQQRLWGRFLESDVPTFWFCAQKAFGRPMTQDHAWLFDAQYKWSVENERDPVVRTRLLRLRELAARRQELQSEFDLALREGRKADLSALQSVNAEIDRLQEEQAALIDGGRRRNQKEPE